MPNKAKFTKEILELEYNTNNLTDEQIATKYGTYPTTVHNSRKRYGIKGKRRIVQTDNFRQKSFQSRFKGCGELSGYHVCCIKANAKRARREFSVTAQYLWELYEKQERKCALTGIEIGFPPLNSKVDRKQFNTASLDRIDNSKGYLEGNVRWVHKHINKLRTDFDDKTFIDLCCLVADKHREQNKL